MGRAFPRHATRDDGCEHPSYNWLAEHGEKLANIVSIGGILKRFRPHETVLFGAMENIMRRTAMAYWEGDLKKGKGTISSESGVLKDVPYNFVKRFEQEPGTNPEELIGAAHAACFSMALSGGLATNGTIAKGIETTATVTLETVDGAATITRIDLHCHAQVPGCSDEKFAEIAENTRKTCPVSRVLKCEITLHAHLV